MTRLRPVEARRLIRFLAKQGYVAVGQTGSHVKLLHPQRGLIVVPSHASHPVKPGLVLKILKQAGLDPHDALNQL